MINAFVDAGFLYCINPGDKVKFYDATSKVFSGEQKIVDPLKKQSRTKKKSYGGYYYRCHDINFKAEIITWGKLPKKWDKTWVTKGSNHYLIKFDNATFIRIKSKYSDTLRLILPDIMWNIARGSPKQYLFKQARLLMGSFCSKYNVSVRNLVECEGTSYAIAVRHPELAKLAQKNTIYFDNGCTLDASHGTPEFEGPLNIMQELISLPERVIELENDTSKLKQTILDIKVILNDMKSATNELKSSIVELKDIFSQSKLPDERMDVT
jgi:hypothetical protein